MGRRQDALYAPIRDAAGLEFAPWNAGISAAYSMRSALLTERTSIAGAVDYQGIPGTPRAPDGARSARIAEARQAQARPSSRARSSMAPIRAASTVLSISCVRTASARSPAAFPPRSRTFSRFLRGAMTARRSGGLRSGRRHDWACFDWNQIEFRLIVNDAAHFGFRGADEVVEIFKLPEGGFPPGRRRHDRVARG